MVLEKTSLLQKMNKFKGHVNCAGILQPAMIYRWRVVFDSIQIREELDILTMQTISCNVNYHKRCITIEIEQSIEGSEHVSLHQLLTKSNFSMRVDILDGNAGIYHTMLFTGCNIEDHNLSLDYAGRGVAKHKIIIKYKDMTVMEPNKARQQ